MWDDWYAIEAAQQRADDADRRRGPRRATTAPDAPQATEVDADTPPEYVAPPEPPEVVEAPEPPPFDMGAVGRVLAKLLRATEDDR